MIRLALAAYLLLLGSCTVAVQPIRFGDGVEQVAAAIRAAWKDHIAAAVRKDLRAVCNLYADEVHYAVAGQPDVHGKPAIEAMEQSAMQSTEVVTAVHSNLALHVDGAIAHELGTVQGKLVVAGGAPELVTFHYAAAWQRGEDGEWRILRLVGHVAQNPGRRED